MTATSTPTQIARIEALEAEAFRAQHAQAQVAARLDHITNALGTLSQDARGVALDIREIKITLAGHDARLDGIDARLDRIDSRLDGIDSTLTGHGELLRAILAQLGGKPEQRSGD